MSLILVTKEQADENSLMHSRTKGSKNGLRLYQYKDGSLTPLGRIHYGIGKARDEKKADKSNEKSEEKTENKSEEKKPNLVERVNQHLDKKAEENRPESRKEERESEKELEKKITSGIENFNKKSTEKAAERSKDVKNFHDVMKSIRGMSDEELNANIDRLQREKRYSELLQDQRDREKGPIYTMVSKALKNAAEDLTKKSLATAVDKLISKAKGDKKGFTLNDYKDVDLYSLESDKLNAVSQAFNNAANIALNKWKIEHPGQDPNQQNNNQNNQNKQNNNQPQNQNQNGNQEGGLSKNQRKKIRSLAASGKSAAELAKQFGVSESTIYQYAGEQLGNKGDSGPSDKLAPNKPAPNKPAPNKPAPNNAPSSKSDTSERTRTSYPGDTQRILTSASKVHSSAQTNKSFASAVKRSQSAIDAAVKEGKSIDKKAEQDRKFEEYKKWLSGDAWEQQKTQIRAEQRRKAEEAERERREQEERRRRRESYARNYRIISGYYN